MLAHRLDALESLRADVAHLLGDLTLLTLDALLLCLVLWYLLLDNVLEKSDLSDLVTVVVDNVAVVVNFAANTVSQVTCGKTTHDIAVLGADLTLTVDLAARHWVDPALLLLWLPALGSTDDVAVLVENVT